MYDYNNGRFLSVDPFIQAPTSTQSMNPYTYIFNNPLSGVDPTGYCSTSDTVKDCGGNLQEGQSENITNENGDVVGSVSIDENGNKVFSDSNGENSVAVSNGSETNQAKSLLQKLDTAISNLQSVVSEQRKDAGSFKYNGGAIITKESKFLGELQSKRDQVALFIELSKTCEPNCKGTIPVEMIELFGKVAQSFGVNVAMGTMNVGRGYSTVSVTRMPSRGATAIESDAVVLTVANNTKGWKVGDPINNLTAAGNVPKWSTVSSRFWKNEAWNNPANYNKANILRMQKGRAPQRLNPINGQIESMELHHIPAQRDGGLFDFIKVWPDEHAAIDPFRHTGN